MQKKPVTSSYYRIKLRYGHLFPFIVGWFVFFLVFLYGLFIFMYVEGWGLLDSFYQVVITLSTVGFTETHELSETGRLLTAILILLGVGAFAYLVGSFTQFVIGGTIQDIWGRRKVHKVMKTVRDHFVVCGYGRIGRVVARKIMDDGWPIVIIENNPDCVEELERQQILVIEGDSTSDEVLALAGLERARGLIACLNHVAENVYVTLSARQANPDLYIVARADGEGSVPKLMRAGADKALTPHMIGGMRIAQMALRPTVIDFLELAQQGEKCQMEEILIRKGSVLVGKDLVSSGIRSRFNLIIIAIRRPSGKMIFNPGPQEVLKEGDVLVGIGKSENFEVLQQEAFGE